MLMFLTWCERCVTSLHSRFLGRSVASGASRACLDAYTTYTWTGMERGRKVVSHHITIYHLTTMSPPHHLTTLPPHQPTILPYHHPNTPPRDPTCGIRHLPRCTSSRSSDAIFPRLSADAASDRQISADSLADGGIK